MTFQIRAHGQVYTVHTEVGGDELSRVQVVAEPVEPVALEASE
jgi:hypothetical protein